jgi:ribosomal protein S18 acetylase RimI-like enzyme
MTIILRAAAINTVRDGDSMKLMTGDGVVFLRPMDEDMVEEATLLYNSSIRYATGFDEAVSAGQVRDILLHSSSFCDQFSSGIFIYCEKTCLPQFAGLVTGLVREGAIWLKLFAVLPQFRRKGIGTRAAQLILRYSLIHWGVTEAFLSVAEENDAGLSFWTSQGFASAATLEKALFKEEIKQKVIIMNKKCP